MGCSHYSYTDSERHCRCHMGCCKAPGPRKAAGAWSPAGSPIRNRQVVAAPAGVLAILIENQKSKLIILIFINNNNNTVNNFGKNKFVKTFGT